MRSLSGLLLTAALSVSSYLSVDGSVLLKEKLEFGVPADFREIGRAEPSHPIQLHIAVKQQHTQQLQHILLDRADPTSSNYGRHLSFDQVNEIVAPSSSTLSAVTNWLQQTGLTISHRTPNSDWLLVDTTVERAEQLLSGSAEYHLYQHVETGQIFLRTTEYSLPSEVHPHIDFVAPSIRFPIIHSLTRNNEQLDDFKLITELNGITQLTDAKLSDNEVEVSSSPNAACGLSVNPTCLRSLYKTTSVNGTARNNSAAVTGYLEQYISITDLNTFFKKFAPDAAQEPAIVGPNVPSKPGVEASLDIQYLISMSPGVPASFEYTAGRAPNSTDNEPFLLWLTNLASNPLPPLVYSTSYGDNENTVNKDYADRIDNEFVKAGARGISLLYSSGDGGVAGGQPTSCTKFIPTYPAGSPWVTAVGATKSTPEVAASFSSGGFANYAAQPSYQQDAVEDYLTKYAKNLPNKALYNASGRAFPDVSAQGVNYNVVIGGFTTAVSGTSCSSPTFAGIVALLNDIRLEAGKTPLGFLNPLFYAHPEVFNDITSGNNPGCSTSGFYAAQGWDPVTGLGTPDFEKLSELVLSLP